MKQDFFELLSDQHVEAGQRWSKVKEKLETDPRYKAVESSALREEHYKHYMEKLAKVGTGSRFNISKVYFSWARCAGLAFFFSLHNTNLPQGQDVLAGPMEF